MEAALNLGGKAPTNSNSKPTEGANYYIRKCKDQKVRNGRNETVNKRDKLINPIKLVRPRNST